MSAWEHIAAELRRHRGLVFAASIAVSAAFGEALPSILSFIRQVL